MLQLIKEEPKMTGLLTLEELDSYSFSNLLSDAITMKKNKNVFHHPPLHGKVLAMIFEKSSTRTRVSFETGMVQLGGSGIFLNAKDLQLGRGESIEDTAGVLSQYVDGIMIRTFSHESVELLSKYSSVPVINGLTDLHHPCQALADYMTILEIKETFKNVRVTYLGDGNNVCHSLLIGAALSGVHFIYSSPLQYQPNQEILKRAWAIAEHTGAKIEYIEDPIKACENTDFIYTDVWTSMGQECESETRIKDFQPYQANLKLAQFASKNYKFMHCLPAVRGEEVTSDVIDGIHSVIFHQAGNRLHAQKALLLQLLS